MERIKKGDQLCVNFWLIFGVENDFRKGKRKVGHEMDVLKAWYGADWGSYQKAASRRLFLSYSKK
jgi:hypothetical protein